MSATKNKHVSERIRPQDCSIECHTVCAKIFSISISPFEPFLLQREAKGRKHNLLKRTVETELKFRAPAPAI